MFQDDDNDNFIRSFSLVGLPDLDLLDGLLTPDIPKVLYIYFKLKGIAS
jgi:hypothetical protein